MAKTVIKKEISIFLASSAELRKDREKFADFVMNLQKHYSNRGLGFQLEKWEYLDSAYNGRRKQDEYNDVIKKSDVFVTLFHNRAGKYTLEEFDLAVQECHTRQLPLFIYFREQTFFDKLKNGTEGLKPITDRITNLQHFWGSYGTNDKLHLDFVLWLDSYIFDGKSPIKVENGHVMLEDLKVAEMSGMSFAIKNKEYQELEATLQKLDEDIEQTRENIRKYPDDSGFPATLSKKVMERDKIQKKLEVQQEAFLGTAKRIAELKKQQVSNKLQKAIDAFEAGQLNDANKLLKELEHEGERLMEEVESKLEQVHKHIDALHLQTQTVMADITIPINERIDRIAEIYAKADDWAQRSTYEKKKYVQMLFDYANFFYRYGRYDRAEQIFIRQIALSEELYGIENQDTATSYNELGVIYKEKGEFDKALEYYEKAFEINERVLGIGHPETATNLNNMGSVYHDKGEYDKALEYYRKALVIRESVFGTEHQQTASSYNNLGFLYDAKGEYDKALEYYGKALEIDEKILGSDHRSTATAYNNIGGVYDAKGEYDKALYFMNKALDVREKVLGIEHPETAQLYNNIGVVYEEKGDFNKALEYYGRALEIDEKILGSSHRSTAGTYNNIGMVHYRNKEYDKALESFEKALIVYESVLGQDHTNRALSYNNIGLVYDAKGEFDKAIENYEKAILINENALGQDHPSTATTYYNIGMVYFKKGEYDKARDSFEKALVVFERVLGKDHLSTKQAKKSFEFTKLIKKKDSIFTHYDRPDDCIEK